MRLKSAFNFDISEFSIKEFQYGVRTFKVKVPTIKEHDVLQEKAKEARNDAARIQERYLKAIEGLEASETVVFQGDDVLIEGNSLREHIAKTLAGEAHITFYFNLLVKDVDDGKGDLSYEDICEMVPEAIQIEIMQKIKETIVPQLNSAKKN